MTLAPADKHHIRDLLESAESAGQTREAALESIERWIAEQHADPGRAEQLADYAARESDRYRLAADRTLPADLAEAARTLRGLAQRMGSGDAAPGWLEQVRTHWPAPIAHEVARLYEDLQGQPDGAGRRLPPSPEAALLQARDTAEVLIKLCACVLLQGLIAADGDDADWAQRTAFRRGLSVGTWVHEILPEAIARVQALPPGPLPGLAATLQRHLLPFARAYPPMRNRGIGHGARAIDPRETATLVEAMLETGRLPLATGAVKCEPLLPTLVALVKAEAFAGWRLQALAASAPAPGDGQNLGSEDDCIDLTGAGAASHWLADPQHDEGRHQGRRLALELRLPDGSRLPLSPLAAARICEQCGRRDVLIYDSMADASTKHGGHFDLLDYARGHKSRRWGSRETDLGEAIVGLDIPLAELPPAGLRDATLSQGWVLRALDQARVDRNYRSPRYLRADLAAFLAECAGGVYWLQAPAHVGKTTFDESRPPEEGDWPLQVLPTADLLPAGLYLVLTSRPLDDPTSPTFLSERIAPLYAGDGADQDVGAPGGRGDLQGDHPRQSR